MTATLNGHQVPDVGAVLRRTDKRVAGRAGDDPLPVETIEAFAQAVQTQIVEPLLGGYLPAPDTGAAEAVRLRGELQRQTDLVDELRKHVEARDRSVALAHRERDAARAELTNEREIQRQRAESERNATQRALDEARAEAASAKAERDKLKARLDDVQIELADTRRQLAEATQQPHRHLYELPAPDARPQPCTCGHEFPTPRRARPGAAPPDPFAELFARIRREIET